MKAWGQIEGRRADNAGPAVETTSRYGGSDWWADCGTTEALERHERRRQRACKICKAAQRERDETAALLARPTRRRGRVAQ